MLAICPGLCLYVRSYQKKIRIFWAIMWRGHSILCLQRNFQKTQRKICHQTIFALILGRMVKLTYCLHQIATFLLPFPRTLIMSTFDAIMAKWLYGHMAIMASNSHIGIWPLWRPRRSLWEFSETPINMWQSGEDSMSIWPSCLKWEQKWSGGRFSFVFFWEFLCKHKIGWPRHKIAKKVLIFFW